MKPIEIETPHETKKIFSLWYATKLPNFHVSESQLFIIYIQKRATLFTLIKNNANNKHSICITTIKFRDFRNSWINYHRNQLFIKKGLVLLGVNNSFLSLRVTRFLKIEDQLTRPLRAILTFCDVKVKKQWLIWLIAKR